MSLEFFIDFNLCSTNERDIVVRGRKILSPKYRQVLASLITAFQEHDPIDRPDPDYKLTLHSHQYADWDNYLKIIGDALEKAGAIDNDRNIVKTDYTKTKIKRGHTQEHFIRIEHYETN